MALGTDLPRRASLGQVDKRGQVPRGQPQLCPGSSFALCTMWKALGAGCWNFQGPPPSLSHTTARSLLEEGKSDVDVVVSYLTAV